MPARPTVDRSAGADKARLPKGVSGREATLRYTSRVPHGTNPTMYRCSLPSSFLLLLLCSCESAPPPSGTPSPAPVSAASTDAKTETAADSDAAKKQKEKDEEAKKKGKELRGKQRELANAQTEAQVAEIERNMRQLGIDAGLARTALELDAARTNLKTFLEDVKPRELEEKKISVDQSTYRAEHQKDELGELTAMYDADEFARTTKELVLKRGRRDLEMAERWLAVARKESSHFEQFALPQRERELRQKVADTELERKKAELDAGKAKIEFELAAKKHATRVSDLEEEIAELQQAMAKEKS